MAYITRISQVRDELAVVGVVVTGLELVQKTLNGVTAPWTVFVQGLVARENLPSWDRVCDDFVQEETRRGFLQCSGSTSKGDEEDVALAAKGKKEEQEGSQEGWGQAVAGWVEEGYEHCEVLCMSQDGTLCCYVSEQEEEEAADSRFS